MDCRTALLTLLDQVDYTAGNCRMNEMVGAVLDKRVIALCREAAQHTLAPDGGTHSQLVSMVNSLANIIIEASGKDGYLSSNDLDCANDCIEKVTPYLNAAAGEA